MKLRRHVWVALFPIVLAIPAAAPATRVLFSSYEPISLQLKAPFTELIDAGRESDDYSVAGTLLEDESGQRKPIDVKISLRGHTSKNESECALPKLKLRFNTPPQDGPFAGLTELKIGTHCGEGDRLTPRFGRLPHERSPYREAFVYRLLDVLQVPTLKARPARISYMWSDSDRSPLVRNAMLLEDDDDAQRRLGADKNLQPSEFSSA